MAQTLTYASTEFVCESTAYCLRGRTASGRMAGPGIVAVDPAVIPLGTRLHVEGYGYAVAGDTGAAIKGKKVDVWFSTREECLQWGRRKVKVSLLQSGAIVTPLPSRGLKPSISTTPTSPSFAVPVVSLSLAPGTGSSANGQPAHGEKMPAAPNVAPPSPDPLLQFFVLFWFVTSVPVMLGLLWLYKREYQRREMVEARYEKLFLRFIGEEPQDV